MPILLDRQLREQIPHDAVTFPITFFSDELASLPDRAGPLHWHPDFEIASAECGVLDYQVGQQHIRLDPGDSIFVNGNMLHGIRQLSGDEADPMPNIVFSGTLAAPETSVIYQKYILPVIGCGTLPFIVFRYDEPDHSEVLRLIGEIYAAFREQDVCFENVIVMFCNVYNDGVYHVAELVGSGEGYFACGGKLIPIRWHHENMEDPITFTLTDGTPLRLGVGNSYIAIAPLTSTVEW